ncbi:MAG: DUF1016 N-terminal domain-containing protein [Pirellulaceae bacterium]|nr:DUF1016 N-terminal domain-containing protein [Pirellulaceae bacterium]
MAKKAAKPSAGELQTSGVFDLESLARSIQTAHKELAQQAARAINVSLTVRNWVIGHYIAEYELNGADRATYGDKLLERLAVRLQELGVGTCEKRQLYQYLRFYHTYPEIVRSLTAQFKKLLLNSSTGPVCSTNAANCRSTNKNCAPQRRPGPKPPRRDL